MKIMKRVVSYITVVLCLYGTSFGDVLLIANKSVKQTSFTKGDVNLIFLGKKKKWDDGQMIKTAVLKEGATHEAFLNEFVDKTPAKFSSFWKLVIVSGTGYPPKSLGTEADMIDYVSREEGAIGYISSSTPHDNVNVMEIK
ncbi:MAG: substrate-binding domain-containing protein [Proteobacteria bacterium]|nr:substrate-binding domain-containing protein [Pseudomonadota bacterium]